MLKIEREHLRTDLKCDIAACKDKRVPAQRRISCRLAWPVHLIDHLSACPSERHLIPARASPQKTVRRLFCLLSRFWFLVVFGVTNQGVACWWQVLFSTTHFGCCVRAELQIVLLRPLSNFNHLFCQSASSKICSSDARFSTDSRRPCFVMPKFCSECGNRVCPEAKFCGECGKRLVCAVPQRQHWRISTGIAVAGAG